MVTQNIVKKNGLSYNGNADGEHHHPQHHPYGNGFAPSQYQQPLAALPIHPLAPPPKKAKRNHPPPNNDSSFPSGQQHPLQGSQHAQFMARNHTQTLPSAKRQRTAPHTHAAVAPPPVVAPVLPTVVKARKRTAAASQPSPLEQNPYSTSRGLRHFSMKVCEKVEERGTTTYNEVADELVRELKQAEEAINLAAAARGEAPAKKKSKKSTATGKTKKSNHDDKNIRRRVYDALNVLMAMDIITKDKKEITWQGLPGSRVHDDFLGDGSSSGQSQLSQLSHPNSSSGDNHRNRKVNGLSRPQRLQQLQEELTKRQQDIRRKKECLQELMVQNVCFQNLLGRNYARELEEQRKQNSPTAYGERSIKNDQEKKWEGKEDKIPLPFIIVNTDSKAVVQCEMCPGRTNVSFDFDLPFEVNDDNEILKRLGMNHTSKEALQRSLPPDLYQYCNGEGLLRSIVRPR